MAAIAHAANVLVQPIVSLSVGQNGSYTNACCVGNASCRLSLTTSSVVGSRKSSTRKVTPGESSLQRSSAASSSAEPATEEAAAVAEKFRDVPLPIVIIDQHTEMDATVLELEFGDRLGALLDTTKALKDLGLSVLRAKVTTDASMGRNRFTITRSDTGGKVEDPGMLEAIRMTVIANLLQYHPESSERLALANVEGFPVVRKQVSEVKTVVTVESLPDGKRSVLSIETGDRTGLITEIVEVLTGLSVNVESAEIETEGEVAKDQFYVSYHGAALNKSMKEVTINCLQYYLTRPDIEIGEDSY